MPRTNYAEKRRWLRWHREQMRVMERLLRDLGQMEEFDRRLQSELDSDQIELDYDSIFDEMSTDSEESDEAEDPQARLEAENAALRSAERERQEFLAAAQAMAASQQVLLDLERARMRAEDVRR